MSFYEEAKEKAKIENPNDTIKKYIDMIIEEIKNRIITEMRYGNNEAVVSYFVSDRNGVPDLTFSKDTKITRDNLAYFLKDNSNYYVYISNKIEEALGEEFKVVTKYERTKAQFYGGHFSAKYIITWE